MLILIPMFPASIIPIPLNHVNAQTTPIPFWIKNNAKWWAEGSVSDNDFFKGIQYLVQQKIIVVPTTQINSHKYNGTSWVKSTVKLWADGQIGDADFVTELQHLIQNGIITGCAGPDCAKVG